MNELIPERARHGRSPFSGTEHLLAGHRSGGGAPAHRYGVSEGQSVPEEHLRERGLGPRINGFRGNMDELVEQSLRQAALWDEVKDKLQQSGLGLSGGQQQRLCIAARHRHHGPKSS